MTFIGEPNLYRCIFQSKKEGAKRFVLAAVVLAAGGLT